MESVIKKIFYGERGNIESFTPSKKYFELLEKLSEVYSEIENKLSGETKIAFKEFCDLQELINIEASDTHFIEGVKLGILLGIETCN